MKTQAPIGREYVPVTYDQFNPSPAVVRLWHAAEALALPAVFPLIWLARRSDYAFRTISEAISLLPFVFGVVVRGVFYRRTLETCGENLVTEFGVNFYYRDINVGRNVLISTFTTVHHCDIGDDVLIGGGCRLLSGSQQHGHERVDIPMNAQGGMMRRITIGADVWIGDNSVVMADVDTGSIVAAGSVVTRTFGPHAICGGNPAVLIRRRGLTRDPHS